MATVFITGCAGFIGYHLSWALLGKGFEVVGYDNINDYYSQDLRRLDLKICLRKPMN